LHLCELPKDDLISREVKSISTKKYPLKQDKNIIIGT